MDTTRYKSKYRIESTRLRYWDYGENGYYFITICVKDHECVLGCIKNGEMVLSEIGKITRQCWQEIPAHFPFVLLDEFVIMPNHVHGIIVIDKPLSVVETQNLANVQTQNIASLPNRFGPQSQNLASIIRGFKIGVKKWATINNNPFQWQSRFYDHIIRNEYKLHKIREYIINNPRNWEKDENYIL
ncbi:MAG: hypothetical protein HZA14_05190 [Nitrospirae bacterium]|nr:hypothetical protein [Nitrospirota bacterium]